MSPKAPALLTDERIDDLWEDTQCSSDLHGTEERSRSFARAIEAEVRTLAAGELEPPKLLEALEQFSLHDVVPPNAHEWLDGCSVDTGMGWREGWDACRNRTRILVMGIESARKQGLLAAAAPLREQGEENTHLRDAAMRLLNEVQIYDRLSEPDQFALDIDTVARASLAGVGSNDCSAHPVDAASTTLPLDSLASRTE